MYFRWIFARDHSLILAMAVLLACSTVACAPREKPWYVSVEYAGHSASNVFLKVRFRNPTDRRIMMGTHDMCASAMGIAIIAGRNQVLQKGRDPFELMIRDYIGSDTLNPGEIKEETVGLRQLFFNEAIVRNQHEDLVLLWTYQMRHTGGPPMQRASGSVLLPRMDGQRSTSLPASEEFTYESRE